jgi:O-antigen/teichoic acid export membrane protein
MTAVRITAVPPRTISAVEGDTRSLFGNFASVLFGRLFAALSMWLALVFLAKVSGPASVGIYALAQTVCIPLSEVAKTGLREIYSSDAAVAERFGDYFGFRLIAALVAFAAMAVSGLIQADAAAVLAVIVIYALVRCIDLISDIIYGLFQAQERMDYIGRSLCLIGPASMLLFSLGYWLTGSLVVAVAGQLVAQLGVLFLHDIPLGRHRGRIFAPDAFRPRASLIALLGMLRPAFPLTIATGLAMVAVYLPRMVVESELDVAALGFFAAIVALAMVPNRLVNTLGMAASVRLARLHREGDVRAFLRLLGGLTAIVAAGGALGLLIVALYGRIILTVVYTEDYAAHQPLLLWAGTAAVLRSLADVLKFGVVASRRFWWIAGPYGAAAAIAVAACFTLIPAHGLIGAGISLVLIFATHLAMVLTGIALNLPRCPELEEAR